jgi:hypothetical protein
MILKNLKKIQEEYSKNKAVQQNPKGVGVVHVIRFAPMDELLAIAIKF